MEKVKNTENISSDDLFSALAEQKANLHDLATMGAVITSIQDSDRVLSVVMEMATRVVNGEVGSIFLEENGILVGKASWGMTYDFVDTLLYSENQNITSYCFENKKTVILKELDVKSDDGLSIDSIICAPIKSMENCYGVIIIINKIDGSFYTDENRETLELLLSFLAVAIENSNLIKERLDRQKVEQEMAIAKQIQETILPQNIDETEGLQVGAMYFPARDVGGDFYDIIKLDDKNLIVIMGDVSNKGVPAALVMSAASAIIKSSVKQRPDISIAELAAITNDTLANEIIKDREMFVTLFYCKIELENEKLTYTNAGHLPGLYWNNEKEKIEQLLVGGPIVGQFPGITYQEEVCSLKKGDSLFLFTDGLTESADNKNQLFGLERAEQVFSMERSLAPQEFCLRVKEWVENFTIGCSEDMVDDFTILEIKVE